MRPCIGEKATKSGILFGSTKESMTRSLVKFVRLVAKSYIHERFFYNNVIQVFGF